MSGNVSRPLTRRSVLRGVLGAGLVLSVVPLIEACTSSTSPAPAPTTAGAPPASAAKPTAAPAQAGGTVEINWYVGKDTTDSNKTLVESFNSSQSKIKVNWQEQPPSTTDQHDKYVSVMAAKDPSIDVFALDIPFVPEFASAGWLQPLDERIDKADMGKFFSGTVQGATYQGKLWAIPWFNNAAAIFYRKDLLEAAKLQPPTTYDDLLKVATAAASPDMQAAFVWQGAQYEGGAVDWFEYVWGFGGDLLDDKGAVVLDSGDAAVQATQFMVDLIHKARVTPVAVTTWKETEARNVFIEGQAVMLRTWLSDYKVINLDPASKVAGKVEVAPLPASAGRKGKSVLGTWNLAISKFSKHPDESMTFIKYLTAAEQMRVKQVRGGQVATRPEVLHDPEIVKAFPYITPLEVVFQEAKPRPVRPDYPQISAEAIQPNLAAALSGQKTAAQTVKDIADKTRSIVKA